MLNLYESLIFIKKDVWYINPEEDPEVYRFRGFQVQTHAKRKQPNFLVSYDKGGYSRIHDKTTEDIIDGRKDYTLKVVKDYMRFAIRC